MEKRLTIQRYLFGDRIVETGWRLSASVGQNQEWLGADNPDLYFSYTGVYNNAWLDALEADVRVFLTELEAWCPREE